MSKYGINIKEFLKKTVIVEAENIEEAVQKVNDAYEQGKIILDANDYDEAEIEPSPYFGNGSGEVADGEDVSFYCHLLEDKEKWCMNKSEIKVGDIVCFKWDCLAGLIERTGKVTQIRKNNVEVYTETPSSNGWSSVPYKNITSINEKRI